MLTIQAVDHIVLDVADMEVSAAWYEQILGMTRVDQRSASGDIRTSMMFGANKINLRPVDVSQESWFTARSPTVGSEDLCFLTTAEPDAVARHFRAHGIEVVAGPIRKSGARGSVQSVYVRDSDGTSLKCRPTANRSPHSAVGREGGSRGGEVALHRSWTRATSIHLIPLAPFSMDMFAEGTETKGDRCAHR